MLIAGFFLRVIFLQFAVAAAYTNEEAQKFGIPAVGCRLNSDSRPLQIAGKNLSLAHFFDRRLPHLECVRNCRENVEAGC
jgi:hypothetical protein